MQVNKPRNQARFSERQDYADRRKSASSRPASALDRNKSPSSKEDALIDLYDDPLKSSGEEELIVNIDFSKPIEILGKLYRQILILLRVAQSKITRENAERIKGFVTRDKKTMAISAVSLLAFFGLVGFSTFNKQRPSGEVAVQGESITQQIELNSDPDFSVLVPSFRTKEQLSIAKISPPNTPAAFAYVDAINGKEIQVTQQELPDRFRANQVEEFKKFAEGFAATEPVKGKDLVAYVGTSVEGPQSVVAIKNDLLILIKSKSKIETDLWTQYLDSLQ